MLTPEQIDRYQQIQSLLKAWFPPEDHSERELPGSKQIWYFVSWQKIRDRLDKVCPDWEVSYSDPIVIEEEICIRCRITICGVTREAPGYAPLKLVSNAGKNMARGSAGERATADSFKNASEAHGICRYLDEQTDKKNKEAFIRYLHKGGNGRAAMIHQNNIAIENGQQPRKPANPPAKPFGGNGTKSAPLRKETRSTTTTIPTVSTTAIPLEEILKLCKFEWSEVTRLCASKLQKPENCLTTDDVRRLRGLLLIEWATMQFDLEWSEAVDCWKGFFTGDRSTLASAELFTRWKAYLISKSVKA